MGKNIQDGGQHRKINPKFLKKPWAFCRRAGIDAALVSLFFAGAPTMKNKIEFKIQCTKVASAKVGNR